MHYWRKNGVSVSVDDSKVAQLIQYGLLRKKLVEGATSNLYLDIGYGEECKETFQEMMDYFNDKK